MMQAAQKHDENDWKEREIKYKAIITNLRAQIRREESAVPIMMYREVVEKSKSLQNEVNQLREQLQQQHSPSEHSLGTGRLSAAQGIQRGRQVTNLSPAVDMSSRENVAPNNQTPASNQKGRSPTDQCKLPFTPGIGTPKTDEQKRLRSAMVKNAGGLKALQEAARRYNSPKTPGPVAKKSLPLKVKNM